MSSKVKNIPHTKDESIIYILSPIWASNFPPAIQYYLKNTDLSGKNIVLVFTCRTANKDTYNEKISKTINKNNCIVKETFYFAIDPENPPGSEKIENDIKSVLSIYSVAKPLRRIKFYENLRYYFYYFNRLYFTLRSMDEIRAGRKGR